MSTLNQVKFRFEREIKKKKSPSRSIQQLFQVNVVQKQMNALQSKFNLKKNNVFKRTNQSISTTPFTEFEVENSFEIDLVRHF